MYINAYLGYYFAFCSGNWDLRNDCLPKLAELFFAYSHKNMRNNIISMSTYERYQIISQMGNQPLKKGRMDS